MYPDFVTAIQAGMPMAPVTVAQREDGWYVYNPTVQPIAEDEPHILVTEQGALMALNQGGSRVLQTLAFTGGSA